jgi:hypothetical protein
MFGSSSTEETLELGHRLVGSLMTAVESAPNRVVINRLAASVELCGYLKFLGFPKNPYDPALPNLVRVAFQEANYDGLDWSDRRADLRQLEPYFELDCRFRNKGLGRARLSDKAYARYHRSVQRTLRP